MFTDFTGVKKFIFGLDFRPDAFESFLFKKNLKQTNKRRKTPFSLFTA